MAETCLEVGSVASVLAQSGDPERFSRYYELLCEENRRVNLVSRETNRTDFDRLCAESILPLTAGLELSGSYLDIGSGGGFPAIPLLIEKQFAPALLVDRIGRKASALTRLVAGLGITARVQKADFPAELTAAKFNLITLRWVKLTPPLLDSIRSFLTGSGRLLYFGIPEFNIPKVHLFRYRFESDPVERTFCVIDSF